VRSIDHVPHARDGRPLAAGGPRGEEAPAAGDDAAFGKYRAGGAYHWREISRHWLHHHAFTAERYRRALAALGPLPGRRVLDFGCGDGAFLSWLSKGVGAEGEAYGFDPNPDGLALARSMLARQGLRASLYASVDELPDAYFDAVTCLEVIEHAHDAAAVVAHVARVLMPGGRAVISSPIRLTETPEDPHHVREWFPGEFVDLFSAGPLRLIHYEQFIPAAAPEVYFWRPPVLLRLPVFRLLCNLLSIYGGLNALSWLRLRPRLFMTQQAVLGKP